MSQVSSGNDESQSSKSFQECKDLAARLSGSYFGVARNKYKDEIVNIVEEGVSFAFSHAPGQLSFLDGVVLHFVSKLPAPDILDIMKFEKRGRKSLHFQMSRSHKRFLNLSLEIGLWVLEVE